MADDQVLQERDISPPGLAHSPFLPNTKIQYAWDSTSLGYLKTCPRLYQYIMLDGWSPRGESIHLRFGQEYHSTLEHFDRLIANGMDREDAIRHSIRSLLERTVGWDPDRESRAGKYKNRDTLVGLVIDYLDHFVDDPTQTFIKSDGIPAVELSFRFELDWGPEQHIEIYKDDTGQPVYYYGNANSGIARQPYLLSGHLDRVVTFNDQLLVMDRKTTTLTLGPYYFTQYEPHNQMTLYTIAGRHLLRTPIRGVIIDAAQILLEKPNAFARGFTYRTDDQLEEWLNDLQILLSTNETYAEANYWPMNDTSCDKYGGCRFRDICKKSPSVREKFLAAEFDKLEEKDRWNPLKSR